MARTGIRKRPTQAHRALLCRMGWGAALVSLIVYGLLGGVLHPCVALTLPIRLTVLVAAGLGTWAFLFSPRGREGRATELWIRVPTGLGGALLGAAFVAPWASTPWLAGPALAFAWVGKRRERCMGRRKLGGALTASAAVVTCGVLAVASSQGLRIPAEEFQAQDFPSNGLLAGVPLHDVWAIELGGEPSATLGDLATAYERFSPFQATPVLTTLGLTRGLAGTLLGWEDPRWKNERESFLHLLAEKDRQRSSTEPGTEYGIWRVLYRLPREGVVETINGTAHVAVAASLGSSSDGPLLYLSFRVREVNWTTPYYMSLIDPARRYFVYPPLLRQFAHTWGTGG